MYFRYNFERFAALLEKYYNTESLGSFYDRYIHISKSRKREEILMPGQELPMVVWVTIWLKYYLF